MQRHTKACFAIALGSALLGGCLEADMADEEFIEDVEFDVGETSQEAGVFPSVASFANRGPFATTQATQGSCTLHSPTTLGGNGVTHPVIIWGNGTGSTPASYQALLSHFASHGFIVAAANTTNAGNGTAMLACLTLMQQNNASSASRFFQRVDPGRVGAAGHSQGGGGTIMAGRDTRVDTTVPFEPFILLNLGGFNRASINQQNPNGTMLLLSGSADTVATPTANQQPVFNGTNVPVTWLTRTGATHSEPGGNGGAFREVATAHFRARLMDDAQANSFMTGFNRTGWTVRRR